MRISSSERLLKVAVDFIRDQMVESRPHCFEENDITFSQLSYQEKKQPSLNVFVNPAS